MRTSSFSARQRNLLPSTPVDGAAYQWPSTSLSNSSSRRLRGRVFRCTTRRVHQRLPATQRMLQQIMKTIGADNHGLPNDRWIRQLTRIKANDQTIGSTTVPNRPASRDIVAPCSSGRVAGGSRPRSESPKLRSRSACARCLAEHQADPEQYGGHANDRNEQSPNPESTPPSRLITMKNFRAIPSTIKAAIT